MPTIADLPVELLLDNLLPIVPVPELLPFLSTNRYFASLGKDDTFWKRKLKSDFNFDTNATARTTGWKLIYRGLRKPHVFVWGEHSGGRLGLSECPVSGLNQGVPMPTELKLPGVRVVSLVAGGFSFHALSSLGNVHVWGTLDSTYYGGPPRPGFASSFRAARQPMQLALPKPIRSISTGRAHAAFVDSHSQIWNVLSWARPFRLVTSALQADLPTQIECGWSYTSALASSGTVLVWWLGHEPLKARIEAQNDDMDALHVPEDLKDGVLQCNPWDLEHDPFRLPFLPSLPELAGTGLEPSYDPVRIVKIAAADNNLIALTNKGHVMVFNGLNDPSTAPQGRWIYLPKFSSLDAVSALPEFTSNPPQTVRITHISANFNTFIAYSSAPKSDVVLIGDLSEASPTISTDVEINPPTSSYPPKVISSLQYKSVISISVGDYHNTAITSTGKLMTWGGYSKGALGLGDPAKLARGEPGGLPSGRGQPLGSKEPVEVRFDHHDAKKGREKFCFAATSAGWHTGALVIDLEDEDEADEQASEHSNDDGIRSLTGRNATRPLPTGSFSTQGPGGPILPHNLGNDDQDDDVPPMGAGGMHRGGLGIFRVGFPGRGMARGRGAGPIQGRNWQHRETDQTHEADL